METRLKCRQNAHWRKSKLTKRQSLIQSSRRRARSKQRSQCFPPKRVCPFFSVVPKVNTPAFAPSCPTSNTAETSEGTFVSSHSQHTELIRSVIRNWDRYPEVIESSSYIDDLAGSVITNGREPISCLGRVFNSKLGCIATLGSKCMVLSVENSAQDSCCKLKFVHGLI